MANQYKQKCWSCIKCTNQESCPWVKNYKLPKGAQVDSKGYIIDCPMYVYDGVTQIKTMTQLAKEKDLLKKEQQARVQREYITKLIKKYKQINLLRIKQNTKITTTEQFLFIQIRLIKKSEIIKQLKITYFLYDKLESNKKITPGVAKKVDALYKKLRSV